MTVGPLAMSNLLLNWWDQDSMKSRAGCNPHVRSSMCTEMGFTSCHWSHVAKTILLLVPELASLELPRAHLHKG